MTLEQFKEIEPNLPSTFGVYRYYNKENNLLYVGKAKNIKKRVGQYFQGDRLQSSRLHLLVKSINRIEFTVVNSEMDALLLENNLIKNQNPKYNIKLKDDKTYPYIGLTNERFPRLIVTRNLIKDGSAYFGPYTSLKIMNMLLDLIKKNFQLRNCQLNLTQQNIDDKRFSTCLEYQIGNCLAPCVGLENEAGYNQKIGQIKAILKGNTAAVIGQLKSEMLILAQNYEFEKAQYIKQKIMGLEQYQAKSVVASVSISDLDVFSVASKDDFAIVNYLHIENGAIVVAHNLEIKKEIDETDEELLLYGIAEIRTLFESKAKEIVIPYELDFLDNNQNLTISIPKIGDKRNLLDLSLKNADFELRLRSKQRAEKASSFEQNTEKILQIMKKELRLHTLPRHIECFDNSNIQGTNPVSAMVCFKNTKPSKKDYRHYIPKTVTGPDDFATMQEVVFRRYKRLKDENQPLPDLIVIDGGKGQLSSALQSLEKLELRGKISIISIAKRLEELFYPDDEFALHLDKNSPTLRIIQQLRDEAHRFGITHHRDRRSKNTFKSVLGDIAGVGEKTTQLLLSKYKSVEIIKKQSIETLAQDIGKKRAETVVNALMMLK